MAERRNNKLEVKLQLMKNDELKKLSVFSENFRLSVDKLDSSMRSYTEKIEKIVMSGAGSSGPSPNGVVSGSFINPGANEAAQRAQAISNSHMAGRSSSSPWAPSYGAPGPSSTPTRPSPAGKESSLNDEVILSQLMSNPMRAFTYQPIVGAAAKWASNLVPVRQDPNTGLATGPVGSKIQWMQNNPQMVAAAGMTLGGAYMATNMSSSGYMGFAHQAGLDTGASGTGLMALPGVNLLTEGGRQAMKATWSDRMASLSPAWSGAQARELRGTMASMGMTEDPDGIMRRMMTRGHSGATTKAFFENARRYRPDQIGGVEPALNLLAEAASAAGMSVEEFSSATAQVAATLSRTLGTSALHSANVANVGSAYGLTPDQSQGLMSREAVFRSMGMGTAGGGSFGERFYKASTSISPNIASLKMRAKSMVPGIENYRSLAAAAAKGDRSAQEKVGIMNSRLTAPGVAEMFGGLSPEQIGTLFDPGKESKARMKEQYNVLRDIDPSFVDSKSKVEELLKTDGKLGKKDRTFLSKFADMDTEERRREIDKLVGGSGGVKDTKQLLGLTDEAKRLVKLMNGESGETGRPRSSNRNSARSAVERNENWRNRG